jgi:hypothetical protein
LPDLVIPNQPPKIPRVVVALMGWGEDVRERKVVRRGEEEQTEDDVVVEQGRKRIDLEEELELASE